MLGTIIEMPGKPYLFVTPIVNKIEIFKFFEESRIYEDAEIYQRFEDFVNLHIGKNKKLRKNNVFVHDTDCKPKSIKNGDIVYFEKKETKKGLKGKIYFVIQTWRQGEGDFFPFHKTNIEGEKRPKENSNSTAINNQFEPISGPRSRLFNQKFIEENENYISHSEISKRGGEPIISRKIAQIGEKKNWINIDDIPKSLDLQEKEIEEYQRKRIQKLGAEVDCWVNGDEEGKLFFKVIWGKNNREFFAKHRDRKYNFERCKNEQDHYFIEIDFSELIEQEEFIIYNKSNEIEIPISRITKNFKSNKLLLEIDSSNSNIIIHSKYITKDDSLYNDGRYPDIESRIQIKLDIRYWDGSKRDVSFLLRGVFCENGNMAHGGYTQTDYSWVLPDDGYENLTNGELRQLLSEKSEPVNGKKSDLIKRLRKKNEHILIEDNSIDIDIDKIISEKLTTLNTPYSGNIAAWKVQEISIISKEKSITYSIKRMDAMYWQALSSTYKHKVILNPNTYDKWQNDNADDEINFPFLIAADTHPKDDVGDLIIKGGNINLNEIDKTEENIVRGVFRHIPTLPCRAENLGEIKVAKYGQKAGEISPRMMREQFEIKIDVTANIDEIINDYVPNTTRDEIIQMNPGLNLKKEGNSHLFIIENMMINKDIQNVLIQKKPEQWFGHLIIDIDKKGSKSLIKFNLEDCFEHSLPYRMFLRENEPIIITNQFSKEVKLLQGSKGVYGRSKYIDENQANSIGISTDYNPLDLRHCIGCTIIDRFTLDGSLMLVFDGRSILAAGNGIICSVSEKDKQELKHIGEFKGWDIENKSDNIKIHHSKDDDFELPPDFIKMKEMILNYSGLKPKTANIHSGLKPKTANMPKTTLSETMLNRAKSKRISNVSKKAAAARKKKRRLK